MPTPDLPKLLHFVTRHRLHSHVTRNFPSSHLAVNRILTVSLDRILTVS